MSRATDFHTGGLAGAGPGRAWARMGINLSPADRELLVRLTHSRKQTASDVIRDLLRAAALALPTGSAATDGGGQ